MDGMYIFHIHMECIQMHASVRTFHCFDILLYDTSVGDKYNRRNVRKKKAKCR